MCPVGSIFRLNFRLDGVGGGLKIAWQANSGLGSRPENGIGSRSTNGTRLINGTGFPCCENAGFR